MAEFIKKFKLESQKPSEYEFRISRKIIKDSISEISTVTDDVGNLISDRRDPETKNITNLRFELTAVSLPSKTPAKVIPVEVVDINEVEALKLSSSSSTVTFNDIKPDVNQRSERPKPINLKGRLNTRDKAPININEEFYGDKNG